VIKVLQSWEEIGEAVRRLGARRLPYHREPAKNWDLWNVVEAVERCGKRVDVIDLGCGGCHALDLLTFLPHRALVGVDLEISILDRLAQLKRFAELLIRRKVLRRPYQLRKRDLTRTQLREDSFDLALCISVLEHGVDPGTFLEEASRLLRNGGILYFSVDYWEEKMSSEDVMEFGKPWNIFSREEIEQMLRQAARVGFVPLNGDDVQRCNSRVVEWQQRRFTFLSACLRLQKSPAS